MATKEEVLEDFFKYFKISLNFILLYSKDHKSFLNSVVVFKEKIGLLFAYFDPIEIIFLPHAVSIQGIIYSKIDLYKDLALLFHQRKIQSLKLTRGITRDELVLLLDKLMLPPKEIIKAGGMSVILSHDIRDAHFSVTDVDYSQLLRGEGEEEEVKEIWIYMVKNAVNNGDSNKINELADNFDIIIQKFKTMSLVEDGDFKASLNKFLEHLEKINRDKFLRCSQSIMKVIFKDKFVLSNAEKLKELKVFFSGLDSVDYARFLWDEILNNENFDISSFQMFSNLLNNEEHQEVAFNLAKNLSSRESTGIPLNASRKIKGLFSPSTFPSSSSSSSSGSPSSSGSFSVPEIYYRALISIGKSSVFKEAFIFDRKQIFLNYRFILLNLLQKEKNNQQLEIILERLFKEWDKFVQESDPLFLKFLGEVIWKKKFNGSVPTSFLSLRRKFYDFVEAFIWEEAIPLGFTELIEDMEESSLGIEVYFKRIFEESQINSRVLKAFLRFFPDKLPEFYTRLKEKQEDIEILDKVLESLRRTDSPLIIPVMESIYSFFGDIIKLEVIRIMAYTGRYSPEFVLEILKNGGSFLRKEVLEVFSGKADTKKAMELMFLSSNPWGKNNKVLMQNLNIVEELDYKEAVKYLEELYYNTAFWNFGLKKKIKKVLEKLNV